MGGPVAAGLIGRVELIAQITDAHVGVATEEADSVAALAAAVDAVAALEPAPLAVLFTGDLAANGKPAEYEKVRELLAPLEMPVHPLMGNHDDRDAFRAAFADHPGIASAGEHLQYTARCGSITVVCCDTHEPDTYAGRLGADRLAWIESELRAASRPTILALHHPPILTGIHEFDVDIPLAAPDRALLAAIEPRPDLIVSGHIHLPITARLSQTPVFVCPSVHLQAKLDLRPGAEVRLVPDPPGFGVHLHGADAGFVSYVQPITSRP